MQLFRKRFVYILKKEMIFYMFPFSHNMLRKMLPMPKKGIKKTLLLLFFNNQNVDG